MASTIQREKELKQQLDTFFRKFGIAGFYDRLSNADFVELKKILSCINNVITLRATIDLVDRLYNDRIISLTEYEAILKEVDSQHANTNGFDVQHTFTGRKDVIGIIAEVKCNIPVNGTSFGAAQLEGLEDDVEHLLKGKTKANIEVKNCYKFMAILNANEHIRECVNKVFRENAYVKDYNPCTPLSTSYVYIVYVNVGKQ